MTSVSASRFRLICTVNLGVALSVSCYLGADNHETMDMNPIAATPKPPYYAVIFTSQRAEGENGYGEMAEKMFSLASQQPGFLGVESVRGADGVGITVSYWSSLEAIRNWKRNEEHLVAQAKGKTLWYRQYKIRICRVESGYGHGRE